ncbi:MAG: hypothetical protein JHC95_00135 [Solirubrobacteraceae bacterium]|nr:hypothetical protein [Solirubrobacteraceae bacterium]
MRWTPLTLAALAAVLAAPAAHAADGTMFNIAGSTQGSAGDGGPPGVALLDTPRDADIAPPAIGGGILIADTTNHRIRRVTPDGALIVRVAGDGTPESGLSGDGGQATSAKLNLPQGVTPLADGSYVIADTGNHRIRRVTPDGVIRTIAGTTAGMGGDGGAATSARLTSPRDVAQLLDGSLLVADTGNNRIRRIANGVITTFAGTGAPGASGDGGAATGAQLSAPRDVAPLSDGSVVIADTGNNRIRRVAPDGTITTIAGGGAAGSGGDGGPATAAQLNAPSGVTPLTNGALLIADAGNDRVRRITPLGTIFTIVGSAPGLSGDGGPASAARLSSPSDVVRTSSGGILVADTANSRVRGATDTGQIPNPVTDRSLALAPTTGTARVRPANTTTAVVLREPDLVADGSVFDTEAGGIAVSVAQAGEVRTTTLTQGRVTIDQDAGRNPITKVKLVAPLTGCPTARSAIAGRHAFAKTAQSKRKGRRERRVVARGNGRFRTDGKYGSATVRGTEWQTTDTCKATSVRVFSGVVSVFDRVRGKRVSVTAGQRVVIRAKKRTR